MIDSTSLDSIDLMSPEELKRELIISISERDLLETKWEIIRDERDKLRIKVEQVYVEYVPTILSAKETIAKLTAELDSYRSADKPAAPWHLPDPPPDKQWHHADWTQEMLPDGWRPLLIGEREKQDDEAFANGQWRTVGLPETKPEDMLALRRTRRPLPSAPVMVPLTRADVPYGSVFRTPLGHDYMPTRIDNEMVLFSAGDAFVTTYAKLRENGWLIHRPGDVDVDGKPVFRCCEKEVK